MGYDFFRLLEDHPDIEPIVYTSGPKSLSNLARHDVDLRFVPTHELKDTVLDKDVDLVVNFSHPFEKRHDLTPEEQVRQFAAFFGRAKTQTPSLRLLHISTMSVYEPFGQDRFFAEDAPLAPPDKDAYATGKLLFESLLRDLPGASEWQLMLRPTVVYGPFCRPWTDGPLGAFHKGDVELADLNGRIQPIWGTDISRFLLDRLRSFQPGTFNLAGPEVMSWRTFFDAYRNIVNFGDFVPVAEEDPGPAPRSLPWYTTNTRSFLRDVIKNKTLKEMIHPVRERSPTWLIKGVRKTFNTGEPKRAPATSLAVDNPKEERIRSGAYLRPFFAEDRLVDTTLFEKNFPGFELTTVKGAQPKLTEYYRYRFTDEPFV